MKSLSVLIAALILAGCSSVEVSVPQTRSYRTVVVQDEQRRALMTADYERATRPAGPPITFATPYILPTGETADFGVACQQLAETAELVALLRDAGVSPFHVNAVVKQNSDYPLDPIVRTVYSEYREPAYHIQSLTFVHCARVGFTAAAMELYEAQEDFINHLDAPKGGLSLSKE